MPENHHTLSVRLDDWAAFEEWIAEELHPEVPRTDAFAALLEAASDE